MGMVDQRRLRLPKDEDHSHYIRRVPLAAPQADQQWQAHAPQSSLGIVRIETNAGVTGIGFGGAGLIGQATIRQLTHELLIRAEV